MATTEQTIGVYEKLADWYDGQAQPKLRDWFLVLAADTALSAGQSDTAERFRGRLLQLNPHHLLKPFESFAEAMQTADIRGYVSDLRVTYPPVVARELLEAQRRQQANRPKPQENGPAASKPIAGPSVDERELKVYRVTAATEQTEPSVPAPRRVVPPAVPARPAPATAPESTWIPPPVAAAPRPVPVSRPLPRPSAPPAPQRAPATTWAVENDPDTATGSWISSLLFILVLIVALGVAVYALVRPFLPAEWFR